MSTISNYQSAPPHPECLSLSNYSQEFIPIVILLLLLLLILSFIYYRKCNGASWNIPSDIDGIRAAPWAIAGGVIGGIGAYIQSHEEDLPDYWTVWPMAFFGAIAALIGIFIISGTGSQKTIRCFTLAIVFGLVWPAVMDTGESLALSRKKTDATTTTQDKVTQKIQAILELPEMDPANIEKTDTPPEYVNTLKMHTVWLISNLTIQEDRESKRESKQIIFQSLYQLSNLLPLSQEAAKAWINIHDEATALRCDSLVHYMDYYADFQEVKKKSADNISLAKSTYEANANEVEGWFRLANLDANQTTFTDFLAHPKDSKMILLDQNAKNGGAPIGQNIVLNTDVYLRTGPGNPQAAGGTTLPPSICVMRDGSEVKVEDGSLISFPTYKQVWIKVSIAKIATKYLPQDSSS